MGFLKRLFGLFVAPRATWATIAAEPPPGMARSLLPLVIAATVVTLAVVLWRGENWIGTISRTVTAVVRPEGMIIKNQAINTRLGPVPVLLAHLLTLSLGLPMLRRGIRRSAMYLGMTAEEAAVRKLALHASTPLWLALSLLPLVQMGWVVMLAASVYALVLLGLGAPILVPMAEDKAPAFGRDLVFRFLRIGFAMILLNLLFYVILSFAWAFSAGHAEPPPGGMDTNLRLEREGPARIALARPA